MLVAIAIVKILFPQKLWTDSKRPLKDLQYVYCNLRMADIRYESLIQNNVY